VAATAAATAAAGVAAWAGLVAGSVETEAGRVALTAGAAAEVGGGEMGRERAEWASTVERERAAAGWVPAVAAVGLVGLTEGPIGQASGEAWEMGVAAGLRELARAVARAAAARAAAAAAAARVERGQRSP